MSSLWNRSNRSINCICQNCQMQLRRSGLDYVMWIFLRLSLAFIKHFYCFPILFVISMFYTRTQIHLSSHTRFTLQISSNYSLSSVDSYIYVHLCLFYFILFLMRYRIRISFLISDVIHILSLGLMATQLVGINSITHHALATTTLVTNKAIWKK